jgi:hypothetical protein
LIAVSVEDGGGELLLDIGSNWGRWSASAASKAGVIGIDPSLGAIMAVRGALRFSAPLAGLRLRSLCAVNPEFSFSARGYQKLLLNERSIIDASAFRTCPASQAGTL